MHRDFLVPVQQLRKELVGNILLYFNILASSISLKRPLPTYLPPAGLARDRLISAVRRLDVVRQRQVKHSTTYLLYFAYAMALKVSLFFFGSPSDTPHSTSRFDCHQDLIDHLETLHELVQSL